MIVPIPTDVPPAIIVPLPNATSEHECWLILPSFPPQYVRCPRPAPSPAPAGPPAQKE